MRLSELLEFSNKELKNANIESCKIDSLLIICYGLNFSKEQVIFNPDLFLKENQILKIKKLISRRANREPVSHIVGKRGFYEDDFFVGSDVLDPRPDSETLIEAILEIFPAQNDKLQILELGVGSGCLILTILKKYINSNGIAVDVSNEALAVAQKNSQKLGLENRIKFINSNWFDSLKESKYDLIISNPPYIKSCDIDELEDEVRKFEPLKALDGGKDGLVCYRDIAKKIKSFLSKDGYLFLEIGKDQENDIIKIFTDSSLEFVKYRKDLNQIIRCLVFKNADI